MKRIALAFGLVVAGGFFSCAAPDRDCLYQTSTLQALLEGVYDGETTCGEVRRAGDTGIGTFDALDGEMVLLDGVVYAVREDGKVYRIPDAQGTPFACSTATRSRSSFLMAAAVAFPSRMRAVIGLPSRATGHHCSRPG